MIALLTYMNVVVAAIYIAMFSVSTYHSQGLPVRLQPVEGIKGDRTSTTGNLLKPQIFGNRKTLQMRQASSLHVQKRDPFQRDFIDTLDFAQRKTDAKDIARTSENVYKCTACNDRFDKISNGCDPSKGSKTWYSNQDTCSDWNDFHCDCKLIYTGWGRNIAPMS